VAGGPVRQSRRIDHERSPRAIAVSEDGMMKNAWSLAESPERPSIASPGDYEVCREIMRTASGNYSFASRMLPARKRRHVDALYAFMRVGDDRVDVTHPGFDSARAAIDAWESDYRRAFVQGASDHPVLRAYLCTCVECGIPADTMAPYFRAMRDDLTVVRYPTFSDLMHYMEGSAIPVGRAMTRILGVRRSEDAAKAMAGADSLALAMQLSNFCRDVGQDWRLGRVYLPLEDLRRFGYSEDDLAAGRVSRQFVALMEFQFARIEGFYREAGSAVKALAGGRWGVMAGLEIYQGILAAIRRNGYDVFRRRAAPGRWRKAGLALKALWRVALS
jgi:phytoene synthase